MRSRITRVFHKSIAQAFAFLLVAGAVLYCVADGSGSDSLAFLGMREKLPVVDSLRLLLSTADELAGAGLFAEAIEVLKKFGPDGSGPSHTRAGQWRLSAGGDYFHLEDPDTAAMTQDELRDYHRVTQLPFTTWLRATYETDSSVWFMEKASADLYVSNYKGKVEAPARININGEGLSIEAALKASKWFQDDASGNTPFTPVKKHPSDMGGASCRIQAQSAPNKKGPWSWEVPLSADWEHYRSDRPGYESFISYRATPEAELRFKDESPFSIRITGEARYDGYYRKESDSLSVARFLARMENNLVLSCGFHATLSASWYGDQYKTTYSPSVIDRWESSLRSEYQLKKWLVPRIAVFGIREKEKYQSTDTSQGYTNPGTDMTVRPSVRFSVSDNAAFEPELTWQRRWAKLQNSASETSSYLWQAYNAWEGAVRVNLAFQRFDFSARGGFRSEDIDQIFERFRTDNSSVKASGDGRLLLFKNVSINLLADYEYILYKPYGTGRTSENLTVSATVSMKF